MKLFKNSVGRPSNEIKKKRKIFIVSMIMLVILFFGISCFILCGVNTNKTLGLVTTKQDLKKQIVGFDSINAEIVGITNTAPYKSLIVADKETGEYWKKIKSGNYCRGTVQIKANKSNKIDFMTVSYTGAHRYNSTVNKGSENIYFSQDDYKNPTKITAMMPNPVKLGEENIFKITVKSQNYDDWGTNDIYSSDMRYMTLDNYYEVVFSDNCKKVSLKYIKTEYSATDYEDGKFSGKLDCPSKGIINEEITCKINFGTKDVNWKITGNNKIISKDRDFVTFKSSKLGNVKVEVSVLGLPKLTKTIKIQNPPVELECPTSAKTNEKFKCTTNQTGVKITIGGAKSLVSGYNSSFTTTSSDKTKDIKFASKLFSDYKSKIKKDNKGKEYIKVKITASKSGYSSTAKYVKIYKDASNKKTTTKKKTVAKKKTTIKKKTTVKKKTTTSDQNSKKANFKVSAVWTNYAVESAIKFNVIQGSFGSKVKYVAYVVCEDELECTASNAWDIMNDKKTGSVTNKIKAKIGDEVVLKLGQFSPQKASSIANSTYYIRRSTYDSNKKMLYYSVYEIKTSSTKRKGKAGDVYNASLTYITGKIY